MQIHDLSEARVTGTAINYLFVCPRKLWFFQNHIEMEPNLRPRFDGTTVA